MATLTAILKGTGASESGGTWSSTPGANSTMTTAVSDTDTVSGHTSSTALESRISGKNKNNSNVWQWAGTWENLGVPAGSTVTNVQLIYDWHCSTYTTGASSSVGQTSGGAAKDRITDSAGNNASFLTTAATFSSTTSWATLTGTASVAVASAIQPSNSTIHLILDNNIATGSSNSAVVALHQTYIQIVITYTPPVINPHYVQYGMRFRNDDGDYNTATYVNPQDTSMSWLQDTNLRVRFGSEENAGANTSPTYTPQLQYQLNGGTWTNVNATSSVVRSSASPNVVDNSSGSSGTGVITGQTQSTAVASRFDEVDGVTNPRSNFASSYTEDEFCIQIRSADTVQGDLVKLRVTDNGTALASYETLPTITVGHMSKTQTATAQIFSSSAPFVKEVGRAADSIVSQFSASVPVTAAPSSGNLLVLHGVVSVTLDQPSGVSDSAGNTWTIAEVSAPTNVMVFQAWTLQDVATLTTSDTVSISFGFSTTAHIEAIIDEFTGVSASPVDQVATGSFSSSTTLSAGTTAATTQATELVVATFGTTIAQTSIRANAGSSIAPEPASSGGSGSVQGMWQKVTSTGTQSPTASTSLTATGDGVVVTYKLSAPTSTKTQTATARIQATPTKTQTATARITATPTKTQTAVARIQVTGLTKTQTATARIRNTAVVKTQTATARIQATPIKTQTAIARISKGFTKTQPSVARIAIAGIKTQTATARIQTAPSKTQTATARIQVTGLTKTQTAVARIGIPVTKIQTATARIRNTAVVKTQTAIARIRNTVVKTQTAVARIQVTPTKSQTAIARIAKSFTKTQTSTARIQITGVKTQTSIARISTTVIKTQPATARVRNTLTKTQTATATIAVAGVSTKTQTATARIQVSGLTKTQTAKARVAIVPIKTQTAKARISAIRSALQHSIARIQVGGILTQLAVARVSITASAIQTATGRIAAGVSTIQTAVARIEIQTSIDQTATARVVGLPSDYVDAPVGVAHQPSGVIIESNGRIYIDKPVGSPRGTWYIDISEL